jgi:hypothetical protein
MGLFAPKIEMQGHMKIISSLRVKIYKISYEVLAFSNDLKGE